jgi:hypothetical protein
MSAPVSVVLAVHDAERTVGAAIDSILAQTFTDYELLVIDDGSTDRSAAVVRERAGGDRRLRLLQQANRGLIATLNRGCAEARGAVIARMDADDVALPGRLEAQMRLLETHPGVAAVGGAARYMDDRGPLPLELRHPCAPAAIRAALPRVSCLVHPTVLMRRDAVLAAGGYRPAFLHAEDYDLWLRLSERFDLANLAETVLHLRLHPGQVSFAHVEQQVISTLGAQVAARARRAGRPDPADGVALIDRRFLIDGGLSEGAIDAAVVAGFVFRGDLMLRCGFTAAAESAAGALAGLRLSAAARRRARAERLWLLGKVEARRRRTGRAATLFASACWARPAFLAHLVRALGRAGGARRGIAGAADGS